MKGLIKAGLVFFVYLVMVFFWALPLNNLPFGDVDSSVHFALSDFQSSSDKVEVELPYYLNHYNFANNGKIWYAPQFHVFGAIAQSLGGRVYGIYIFYLLSSTFIFWSVFFLIYKLYGFWPGFLSSSLLIFSVRDYTTYVWGLFPERAGFIFIPIILYSLYKYYESVLEGLPKQVYLYVYSVLVVCAFFIHPQTLWMSFVFSLIFTFFVLVKWKKLPFKLVHTGIALVILILLILPFFIYPFGGYKGVNVEGGDRLVVKELSSLFKWYPVIPYRPDFGSFSLMHNGYWILPFLLVGLFYLSVKRRLKDLLLLSWFVGFYLLIHLNIIGQSARIHRFLNSEAHIFYPIAVVGLFFLLSLLEKIYDKKGFKEVAACSLILLFVISSGIKAYPFLDQAYDGLGRLTPAQLEACVWVDDNLPPDIHIRNIGTVSYSVRKWVQNMCRRYFIFDDQTLDASMAPDVDSADYLFVDNDNLIKAGLPYLLVNGTLVYNSKGVLIYDVRH